MAVSGGARLIDRLNRIATNLDRGGTVRVGFLEKATYPSGQSVAMIAAINEYGAPSRNIPPRPFFRGMVKEKSPQWPATIEKLAASTDYDAEHILRLMGEEIAGQLRQAIVDFVGVPLKPATIRAKGHDKQLVNTGHLLGSVDYEVDTK